jgi:hypothetical protein
MIIHKTIILQNDWNKNVKLNQTKTPHDLFIKSITPKSIGPSSKQQKHTSSSQLNTIDHLLGLVEID